MGNRAVRDIRTDLRDRIAAKRRDQARFTAQADQAAADVAAFERLLADEESRLSNENFQAMTGSGALDLIFKPPSVPLEEFMAKEIARGPKTKDELTEAAKAVGYFKESTASPGRVVHAKLLILRRTGRVRKQDDGRMVLADIRKENALTVR